MKFWFGSSNKHADKIEALAGKELSDDLMSQIAGGQGKGACHTARLSLGIESEVSLPATSLNVAAVSFAAPTLALR